MPTYFDAIPKIAFEGPASKNPLAFKYYDPKKVVLGKTMAEHLRIAVCYWHSFAWPGNDIFGAGTFDRPWKPGVPMTKAAAEQRAENAFAFFERLGAPFYCFHDVDAMADGPTPAEYKSNLAHITDILAEHQERSGVKLLWGTANLFSHPRYMAGGATNPDPDVVAWASLQVREMLETTHKLGGVNYVLWGGREGYDTILNTNLKQELDQLGRFVSMVVEHKHKIGFNGTILIEPKPHEPTKHQYDRDTATVFGFLKNYGLENEVKVNIEANHATLAGNSFEHEIATAVALGIMGSIDINRGDAQNGWDTDQFPNNVMEITQAIYELLQGGGFTTGGFNFDSKVRRQSVDAEDMFYAHIGGMDVLARGLLGAAKLIEDGELKSFTEQRYAGWKQGMGQKMLAGTASLADMADHAVAANLSPVGKSGRQEYLENIVNNAC
ncbi:MULTISPECIES: xylose isomerase [Asticcacaulis]|uniref:xylose isomerase n=1 Tax=Asticcacaulis TaxID=76890 RepID=UPI001AE3DF0A|nr:MULTISPECIES: xylose isomerase [Asticcacaulis]MBP2159166.1 xylose isomerase [Asticcacaulis solisilvae]MDR6800211.1 xylose isomerase [Asticcacaulis sp. BE141]